MPGSFKNIIKLRPWSRLAKYIYGPASLVACVLGALTIEGCRHPGVSKRSRDTHLRSTEAERGKIISNLSPRFAIQSEKLDLLPKDLTDNAPPFLEMPGIVIGIEPKAIKTFNQKALEDFRDQIVPKFYEQIKLKNPFFCVIAVSTQQQNVLGRNGVKMGIKAILSDVMSYIIDKAPADLRSEIENGNLDLSKFIFAIKDSREATTGHLGYFELLKLNDFKRNESIPYEENPLPVTLVNKGGSQGFGTVLYPRDFNSKILPLLNLLLNQ